MCPDTTPYMLSPQRTDTIYKPYFCRRSAIHSFPRHAPMSSHTEVIPYFLRFPLLLRSLVPSHPSLTLLPRPATLTDILEWFCIHDSLHQNFHSQKLFFKKTLQHALQFILYNITTVHLKSLPVSYSNTLKYLPQCQSSDAQLIQFSKNKFWETTPLCTLNEKRTKPFLHCDILSPNEFLKNETKLLKNQRQSLCLFKRQYNKGFSNQHIHCCWASSLQWILLACHMNEQIIQLTNLLKDQDVFHKQWMQKKNCQINRLSSFIKQISHELCLSTEAFRLLYKQLETYNAQEQHRDELSSKKQSLFKNSSSLVHLNPFPFATKTLKFIKQTTNDRVIQKTHDQTYKQLVSSQPHSSFKNLQNSKSNSFTIGVGLVISDTCLPARCVSNSTHVPFHNNVTPDSAQATSNVNKMSLVSFSVDPKQQGSYTPTSIAPCISAENKQCFSCSPSLYRTGHDAQCHDSQMKSYTCVMDGLNPFGRLQSYVEKQQKLHPMLSNELCTSVGPTPRQIRTQNVCSDLQAPMYPFGNKKPLENTNVLSYRNMTLDSFSTVPQQLHRINTSDSYSSNSLPSCQKAAEIPHTSDKQAFRLISLEKLYATRNKESYQFSTSTPDDTGEKVLYQNSIASLNITHKDAVRGRSILKSYTSGSQEYPPICKVEPHATARQSFDQICCEQPYISCKEALYQSNEETYTDLRDDALYQDSIGRLIFTDCNTSRETSTLRSYVNGVRSFPASCTATPHASREKNINHVTKDKPFTPVIQGSHQISNKKIHETCKEKLTLTGTRQPYVANRKDLYRGSIGKPYTHNKIEPRNITSLEAICSLYGVSLCNPKGKDPQPKSSTNSVLSQTLQLSTPEIVSNTPQKHTIPGSVNHQFSMRPKNCLDLEKELVTAEINRMKPFSKAYSSKGTKKCSFFSHEEQTVYKNEAKEVTKSSFQEKKEFVPGTSSEFKSLEAYDKMVYSSSSFNNMPQLKRVPSSFFNKNLLDTHNTNQMLTKLKPLNSYIGDQKCTNKTSFLSSNQNDFLTEHMLDLFSLETTIENTLDYKFEWENRTEQHSRRTSTKRCQHQSRGYHNEVLFDKESNAKVVAKSKLNNVLVEHDAFISPDQPTTWPNLQSDLRQSINEWNLFWWHQQKQLESFFNQRSSVTKIKLVTQQLPLPYKNYDKNRVVIIATDVSPFQLKKSIGKYGDWDLLKKILVSLPPVDPRFVLDVKAWMWVATKKILFLTSQVEKNTTELTVISDKTIRNMLIESLCLSTLNMTDLGYSNFQQFNDELKKFSLSSQCHFSRFIDSFLPSTQHKDTGTFINEHFLKPTYVTKQLFTQSIQYLGHSMNNQCSTTIILCCGIGHFFERKNITLSTTDIFQPLAEKDLQTDCFKNFVHKQSYKKVKISSELDKSSTNDWIHTAFLIPSDFLSLKHGSPNVLLVKLIRLEKFLHLSETMRRNTELTILIDTGGVGTEFYSFAEKNLQAFMLPHEEKESCHRISNLINDSLLVSRTAPNGGTVHVRLCRYKRLTYNPKFHTMQSSSSQQKWGYREVDLTQFINNIKILCPSLTFEIEYD